MSQAWGCAMHTVSLCTIHDNHFVHIHIHMYTYASLVSFNLKLRFHVGGLRKADSWKSMGENRHWLWNNVRQGMKFASLCCSPQEATFLVEYKRMFSLNTPQVLILSRNKVVKCDKLLHSLLNTIPQPVVIYIENTLFPVDHHSPTSSYIHWNYFIPGWPPFPNQ